MMDLHKYKGKLLNWVKGQGSKQKERSGPWKLISGLFVSAIAMAGLAFMYYRSWRQGKEIAKLKHERDVANQKKRSAALEFKVTTNKLKEAALRKKRLEASQREKKLNKVLKGLEKNETKNRNEIANLQNWRDIDSFLSKH